MTFNSVPPQSRPQTFCGNPSTAELGSHERCESDKRFYLQVAPTGRMEPHENTTSPIHQPRPQSNSHHFEPFNGFHTDGGSEHCDSLGGLVVSTTQNSHISLTRRPRHLTLEYPPPPHILVVWCLLPAAVRRYIYFWRPRGVIEPFLACGRISPARSSIAIPSRYS